MKLLLVIVLMGGHNTMFNFLINLFLCLIIGLIIYLSAILVVLIGKIWNFDLENNFREIFLLLIIIYLFILLIGEKICL